ncbi:MAG: ADP-ribosylglycohydrolase family protein [Candidatus Latescibacteria bacterium]|jgi:ADP-ribosyl-[dinitrogen reductase] hydrolase|nr:ADP-ribosylglycohydrolase family protein [Candidatus Latescibacterota bacterium]MBT4138488.1 ADP-ribosylglycohydrolase family protein [Candidatus Latescibacterota bacterium]
MANFSEYSDPLNVNIEDLFVGSLLGGAIGDALGSFCEGWTRSRILGVDQLLSDYRDRINKLGEVSLTAGSYTDDTQQLLVIVESILACDKVDAGDLAARYLDLWRAGELHSYGAAFKETLEKLDAGVVWEDAASVDKLSNGTVMKIAPVGLWHWATGEDIRQDALAVSWVTHREPRTVAAAVSVAHVVGHLVTHRPLDLDEVLDVAEWSARAIDEPTGELIGRVRALLGMDADLAWKTMREMAICPLEDGIPGEGPMTAVVALEAFLRSPKSFEATLIRALTAGGDVDTFAAVAGNLSGVYNGTARLPDYLMDDLLERSHIESLARALYQKTIAEEGLDVA